MHEKHDPPAIRCAEIEELMDKVCSIRDDVSDVDRLSKVMENVSLLNETLRVANDEYEGFRMYSEGGADDGRKRVEETSAEGNDIQCVRAWNNG